MPQAIAMFPPRELDIKLLIKRLPHGQGLDLPCYATSLSAGLDLQAAIEVDIILAPQARMLIPTGFCIALPEDYEAQIRPRSGLAFKNGVTVLNSPGTIDADYRGEVKILLINLSNEPFTITRGTRIAQMVIAPVARVSLKETEDLPETVRGHGGFGSTGTGKL
ncbi:MAG: dUTP diphosphatase [Alphaproteobacteria bacterium]